MKLFMGLFIFLVVVGSVVGFTQNNSDYSLNIRPGIVGGYAEKQTNNNVNISLASTQPSLFNQSNGMQAYLGVFNYNFSVSNATTTNGTVDVGGGGGSYRPPLITADVIKETLTSGTFYIGFLCVMLIIVIVILSRREVKKALKKRDKAKAQNKHKGG